MTELTAAMLSCQQIKLFWRHFFSCGGDINLLKKICKINIIPVFETILYKNPFNFVLSWFMNVLAK